MKFSDRIIRESLDDCFVKRTEKEMRSKDETDSLLWDVEKYNISYDNGNGSPVHLFIVQARDVKISENIYDETGDYIAYRSE
jgi:hypothetical protein